MPAPEQNQSYSDEWLRQVIARYRDRNFVQRLMEPGLWGQVPMPDGRYASHLMSSSDNIAFPTITWDQATKSLVPLGIEEARQHALKTRDYIPFASDKDADYFAREYKRAFPNGWFDLPTPKGRK